MIIDTLIAVVTMIASIIGLVYYAVGAIRSQRRGYYKLRWAAAYVLALTAFREFYEILFNGEQVMHSDWNVLVIIVLVVCFGIVLPPGGTGRG